MPNTVQRYSFAQLEGLWIQAGGDRASAPIMAAIALAESSGNPAATNKNTNGTIDRGLWQINSVHGNLSTFDPLANAQAAVKIKKSQGLNAWVTYSTGAYRQFLKGNVAPDTSGLPSGSTNTATDASNPLDLGGAIGEGFAAAFSAMLQPIVELSIWGGEILLGIGVMVAGMIVFLLNTDAGKSATRETRSLAGTALSAAAPETYPELAALSRIRNASGRRAIVQERAREAAQNSPRGRQVAAQQRERKVQQEQQKQAERKAVRKEAARRNRDNGSTGNRKS